MSEAHLPNSDDGSVNEPSSDEADSSQSSPAPTDEAPTDEAPTDEAPTDEAPTDEASTENVETGDTDHSTKKWRIENIAELSKNTRSLYLIYLSALLYCAVTVVSVTDRQMLLNEAVTLPLISVDVPLRGFFGLAPFVLIVTFVYLQLYLQDLQRRKRKLREENAEKESERLYPWIMNLIDDPKSGCIGKIERAIVKIVLWLLLPIVVSLFSYSFLRAQEPILGTTIIVASLLSLVVSLFFWYEYDSRGQRSSENGKIGLGRSITACLGVVSLVVLSYYFVSVVKMDKVPDFGSSLLTIDVSYQSLIQKEKYGPYWVNLRGRKLRGANLEATTMIKADLSKTRLDGANFQSSQLDSANLSGSDLPRAILIDADLTAADLSLVDLSGGELFKANLSGANVWGANLSNAQLSEANLSNADLSEVNLSDALFQYADVSGANLSDANASGARIGCANLQGANITRIQASVEQLCGAASLYGLIASADVLSDIEAQCPARLRPPSKEELAERCPYATTDFVVDVTE